MPPFHDESQIYRNMMKQDSKTMKQYSSASSSSDRSRTKHKLQLQRLSFLTNDKNYLDHPQNMRRLTKELDRVDREYRSVRQYQDPLKESFKRLLETQKAPTTAIDIENTDNGNQNENNLSTSTSSLSSNNSGDSSPTYPSSAEKNNFLSRWFNNGEESSSTASLNDTSLVYTLHPTIATHMKRRRAVKDNK